MTDVEIVSPPICLEIIQLGRGAGLIRSRCRSFAASVGVLHVHCQPGTEAPLQRELECVVPIITTTGLIVDLCERIRNGGPADNAELANRGYADDLAARVRSINDAYSSWNVRPIEYRCLTGKNLVCNASQEEVAAAAANITERSGQVIRKLLLPRNAVLKNSFRNLVIA